MSLIHFLGLAEGGMCVAMLVAFAWYARGGKAGIVDAVWAFGVGVVAIAGGLLVGVPGARTWLALVIVGIWSVRLGTMLGKRVLAMEEDGRYQRMLDASGDHAKRNMLLFFLLQAAWTPLFSTPCILATMNQGAISWLDVLGAGIALIAMVGEGVADSQLAAFRSDPSNIGKVCRRGLWRYSRHPNYFFEWTWWFAWPLMALRGPYWQWTLAGPVLMFLFLWFVTGIPHTEKQALSSRGEAYREYQRTTSPFFPWPPKQSGSAS